MSWRGKLAWPLLLFGYIGFGVGRLNITSTCVFSLFAVGGTALLVWDIIRWMRKRYATKH